jgi:methionyl-tRNA synthetase
VQHIESNPDFIKPDARRKDILSRLQREPLLDLSISRTTFDWGIPVPDDPKHVMCVRPEPERSRDFSLAP